MKGHGEPARRGSVTDPAKRGLLPWPKVLLLGLGGFAAGLALAFTFPHGTPRAPVPAGRTSARAPSAPGAGGGELPAPDLAGPLPEDPELELAAAALAGGQLAEAAER